MQKWVVHCKVVGDGRRALRYLARVSISDRRLVKLKNGRVLFRYRPTGRHAWRVMSLSADEFMRRFLQHVLPKGFVKVRYYGLFSPAYRKRLAALHKQWLFLQRKKQSLPRSAGRTGLLPGLRSADAVPQCESAPIAQPADEPIAGEWSDGTTGCWLTRSQPD